MYAHTTARPRFQLKLGRTRFRARRETLVRDSRFRLAARLALIIGRLIN